MLNRRSLLCGAAMALGARRVLADTTASAGSIDGVLRLADGRTLAYRQYGDPTGAPAFYFHGMPGSRLEPGLVADEVAAAGVRLIALDRPGIGRSSFQSCRRVTDWPADVAQLADALPGFDRFSVVGVSGGAPFALACAIQLPDRVKTVALVSGHTPFGVPDVIPGNQDRLVSFIARRPRLAKTFMTLMRRRLYKRPDKALTRLGESWTDVDRQLVLCDPKYRAMLLQNLRQALRCPVGLVHDAGLLARPWGFSIRQVRSPVAIWQGCRDRVSTPSMAHHFHREIEGSQLTLDETSSHVTTVKWHASEWLSWLA